MSEHCWKRGLPMRWVTGDEVYGNATHLRQTISCHGKLYVLAVSATTTGWLKRPQQSHPRHRSQPSLSVVVPVLVPGSHTKRKHRKRHGS